MDAAIIGSSFSGERRRDVKQDTSGRRFKGRLRRESACGGACDAQEEGEEVGESKGQLAEGSLLPDEVRSLLRRMVAAQSLLLAAMQRMRDDANEREKEGMLLRMEQQEEEAKSAEASAFMPSQEASASIMTRHQNTLISGTFAAASFLSAKAGVKFQDIEAGATVLKATPKRSFADVWSSLLSQSLSLSRARARSLSLSSRYFASLSRPVASCLIPALCIQRYTKGVWRQIFL